MTGPVESVRQEWEESHRRLESEAARDRDLYNRLRNQVELVAGVLRKRVGETFTLEELAREYGDADRWTRDLVDEAVAEESPEWPRTLSLVEGAAFHLYSRGAVDYEP